MKKRIFSLLLAVLAVLLSGVSAAADGADRDKIGSICVSLLPLEENQGSTASAVLSLYRVGDIKTENGLLGYTLTEDFCGSNIGLSDVNAPGLAGQLSAYAELNTVPCLTKKTDEKGSVLFSGLKQGLYLIVQEGSLPGCLPAAPFLVSLPMTAPDGSGWIYDICAGPKIAPEPDGPDTAFTELSVWKSWAGAVSHPAEITVHLMKGGKIYDTVKLNKANDWRYKWENLSPDYLWTVAEDVPEGWNPVYSRSGSRITIVNTKKPSIPDNPEELTVKKIWSGTVHPDFITVELWNGDSLYDRIRLSAENGWTHTWKDLPDGGSWELAETPVPSGYYPTYSTEGNIISIKNSPVPEPPEKPLTPGGGGGGGGGKPPLIQTGQLNWPVPVLAGGGVLLFAVGWILCYMKGRKDHEA